MIEKYIFRSFLFWMLICYLFGQFHHGYSKSSLPPKSKRNANITVNVTGNATLDHTAANKHISTNITSSSNLTNSANGNLTSNNNMSNQSTLGINNQSNLNLDDLFRNRNISNDTIKFIYSMFNHCISNDSHLIWDSYPKKTTHRSLEDPKEMQKWQMLRKRGKKRRPNALMSSIDESFDSYGIPNESNENLLKDVEDVLLNSPHFREKYILKPELEKMEKENLKRSFIDIVIPGKMTPLSPKLSRAKLNQQDDLELIKPNRGQDRDHSPSNPSRLDFMFSDSNLNSTLMDLLVEILRKRTLAERIKSKQIESKTGPINVLPSKEQPPYNTKDKRVIESPIQIINQKSFRPPRKEKHSDPIILDLDLGSDW